MGSPRRCNAGADAEVWAGPRNAPREAHNGWYQKGIISAWDPWRPAGRVGRAWEQVPHPLSPPAR